MEKAILPTRKEDQSQIKPGQTKWQRITLLAILGYEAAGCLLGGSFLMAAPDGRFMDMPVDMMHGVFPDFMIPGIILFGLGILNVAAFVSVLRRSSSAWLTTGLALGGLAIWFGIEIYILQGLHWLHIMWGLPVVIGCLLAMPLFTSKTHKALLVCGIASSLFYAGMNILTAFIYNGYSAVTQTVSEISAIGAPTRLLWVSLAFVYSLLVIAFGAGVWYSATGKRRLKIVSVLFVAYAVTGLFWPPMHQREVLAAGGDSVSDTLHIAFTLVTVPLFILMIILGASASGKLFKIYSISTLVVLIVAGIFTGIEAPNISKNLSTPSIGVWERINIGVYMLWVIVFAIVLLKAAKRKGAISEAFTDKPLKGWAGKKQDPKVKHAV
jgi:Protein of unknown function (DUF998)